jgi:hypothetical protein
MKKILEKILTEKNIRSPHEIEAFSATHKEFSAWND